MGLEKLTDAFGILMMFQGIAAIIGGPLAGINLFHVTDKTIQTSFLFIIICYRIIGFFMDLTNSFDASFYIAGGFITFSALLCYPLNMTNKWEKSVSKPGRK